MKQIFKIFAKFTYCFINNVFKKIVIIFSNLFTDFPSFLFDNNENVFLFKMRYLGKAGNLHDVLTVGLKGLVK